MYIFFYKTVGWLLEIEGILALLEHILTEESWTSNKIFIKYKWMFWRLRELTIKY